MAKTPELSREAVLHAQADTRNIPEGRTITQNVVSHAQADMAALPPESPGLVERERGFFGKLADSLRQAWDNTFIGGEHAKGMLKLGLHELTAALTPLPDSNIRPMEEPGVFGNEGMPHIKEHNHEYHSLRGHDTDRTRDSRER